MPETIDALFIPFYANIDRWKSDEPQDYRWPSLARTRGILDALSDERWMKDEVDLVVDGELLDFSRFLSWVRYGSTSQWARYDPFAMTLLSGSYYLSFLSQRGFSARVINVATRTNLDDASQRYDPRFVLLSTTLLFDGAEQDLVAIVVQQIRRTWPDAVVVLGGLMLVSYRNNLPPGAFRDMLLRYGADVYVISAQGESPLLRILERGSVRAIVEDASIPNTWVVMDGKIIEPPSVAEEGLPLAETSIRWSRLPQTEHLYHTVHMRTARSCAFKCAFCEYPVNQGPLTLMPLEVFEAELRELQALGTVRSIVFTDDTFNVPLARFKEMLRVLARYDFEWYSFFRPQYADAETARLMKEAHCRAVFAGLEAADDQMLINMHKVATVDKYRRGLEALQHHDIRIHANFIVGFPGETEGSARKIARFLDDVGIEFCTVCTWVYLPSTPIRAQASDWEIEGLGVDWKHKTMTSADAQKLAREIVHSQKSAVHNAVRGEAWTEFLLYANGFTVDEARLAVSTFNSFLGRDCSEDELRSASNYSRLKAVLHRHDMPPVG